MQAKFHMLIWNLFANSGPHCVKETRAHKVKDIKESSDFPSAESQYNN